MIFHFGHGCHFGPVVSNSTPSRDYKTTYYLVPKIVPIFGKFGTIWDYWVVCSPMKPNMILKPAYIAKVMDKNIL